jgi:hypothetical protein
MKKIPIQASLQVVEIILNRMAVTYDARHAISNLKPFSAIKPLCHMRTLRKIEERQNPRDIIWLYGDGHIVYHSCLSDAQHNVLVGAQYGQHPEKNRFLGDDGFEISNDFGVLELMSKMTVGQWMHKYFKA